MSPLLWFLLIGLVAGWLGLVMGVGGYGLIGDLIIGVLGIRAGGLLGALLTAFVGAVVLLFLVRLLRGAAPPP
jgi:uncharacterized membrane protein YeaQ/YmgE (transglycosylase-associated protein family)